MRDHCWTSWRPAFLCVALLADPCEPRPFGSRAHRPALRARSSADTALATQIELTSASRLFPVLTDCSASAPSLLKHVFFACKRSARNPGRPASTSCSAGFHGSACEPCGRGQVGLRCGVKRLSRSEWHHHCIAAGEAGRHALPGSAREPTAATFCAPCACRCMLLASNNVRLGMDETREDRSGITMTQQQTGMFCCFTPTRLSQFHASHRQVLVRFFTA